MKRLSLLFPLLALTALACGVGNAATPTPERSVFDSDGVAFGFFPATIQSSNHLPALERSASWKYSP